ncbi:latent-transforming growth factor beta-binding protein 2 [Eurytemora carolleeae]|uniref:latent-transforming growth factor beta-binding protein 2 n=1 Tax=Eurytemora carolleeae TaxID=1294199 RepID=UPI000C791622|nr:latent-transforming growth factor beta-binding protein 2 [Eurytemora carolleeae]|eukprot:XP_023321785.1 latent-transforming growth factor beta-binding protein 2-like [Eurytemora affinis]
MTGKWFLIFLVLPPPYTHGLKSTVFMSTMNMTYSTFTQYRTWTLTAKDEKDCGTKCLHFGNCNSFWFQQTSFSPGTVFGTCEGAMLSTLVDTDNGIRIFIDAGSYDEWDILCRTGRHWGEGGLWDAEDDCCEPPCTPDHPCAEGEGHCEFDADCQCTSDHPCAEGEGHSEVDADCQNPGWLKCGNDFCVHNTYFPSHLFPKHSLTFYQATDNCCYRVCNKRYNVCGHNAVGCLNDEDCSAGLYCKKDVAQPYCEDVNECDPNNPKNHLYPGLAYCGIHTTCTNTIGSFSCSCQTGYNSWIPVAGCIDIDECATGPVCGPNTNCWNTEGSFKCSCKANFKDLVIPNGCVDVNECDAAYMGYNYCGTNTVCTNTIGSASCACAVGFRGDPYTVCSDVNECAEGVSCGVSTVECFNTVGSYYCSCSTGYERFTPGYGCYDTNECATSICGTYGSCTNQPGTYSCTCIAGFTGTPPNCVDINECVTGHNCAGIINLCVNTLGGYRCSCQAAENSLASTSYSYGCKGADGSAKGAVRLGGGFMSYTGIVEYNHRNSGWGAICQNGFDWGEADAICRQLGWGGAYTYSHGYPYSGIYIFADMLCGGTELDLDNCPRTLRPSTTVCAGSMAAFVHCW